MMCKLKGWMHKGEHYVVEMIVDGNFGIMMCKLKGQMDKRGHYDVEMKGWMQKEAIGCANYTGGWIRESIIIWK